MPRRGQTANLNLKLPTSVVVKGNTSYSWNSQNAIVSDGHNLNLRNQNEMETSTKKAKTSGPILVCGGAGYIGSHTILCLLEQGYNVVVVDNLVNSSMASLDRVAELAGLNESDRKERLVFHNVDLCDRDALKGIFETHPTFSACIHFAGNS